MNTVNDNSIKNTRREAFPYIAFIMLFSVALLADTVSAMMSASISLYMTYLGGSAIIAGTASSLYFGASFAMRPIGGALADRIGHNKILLGGSILCIFCSLLFRFSGSAMMALLAMVLRGIGLSSVTTTCSAKLSTILPNSQFDTGVGIFALNLSIANAVGPAFATGLAIDEKYALLFNICILLSCLSTAGVLYFLIRDAGKGEVAPEKRPENDVSEQIDNGRGIWRFVEKRSLRPGIVQIAVSFSLTTITVFLTLFAAEKKIGNAGIFFTCAAFTGFLARLVTGLLTKNFKTRHILSVACIIMVGIMATLLFISQEWQLVVLGLVYGFAQGIIFPTLMVRTLKYAPKHRKGVASATYYLCNDVGYGLGSLVWGFIADLAGYSSLYICGALLFVGTLILIPFMIQDTDSATTD